MARYTDIDKLIAEYDRVHVGPAGGARKLMVEAPIADVAPRAEVAREIFEEIEEARKHWESIWKSDPYGSGGGAYGYLETDVDSTIYDLKKKYTEGEK